MAKRKKRPLKNSKEYKRRRMHNGQLENDLMQEQFCAYANRMKKSIVNNKETIVNNMNACINAIIDCFNTYDSVMLLGGIGLRLLNNLPNLEKHFWSQTTGQKLDFDESAEVVAEYAMNFALSVPNEKKEIPDDIIIDELYQYLKDLKTTFAFLEIPNNVEDIENSFSFISHAETISVRGAGYMTHIEEVYNELFTPHSCFFENKYGFSITSLFNLCTTIENRIYSKIGNNDTIYGAYKSWERMKEWAIKEYGNEDSVDVLFSTKGKRNFMHGFLKDNPDLAGDSEESEHCVLYEPDDFRNSDKIFWIVPQNDEEKNILEAISVAFGDNGSFIADGPYKGNIMNGTIIFTKPIIKDNGKFLCFTPLLLYRNLFSITENLMMEDRGYYDANFRNNTLPIARDCFFERKVKDLFEKFLPTVNFYSSCNYAVDGKRVELDILGISKTATYVIEVKGHELSYKNKVRTGTLKSKFMDSATKACIQCRRAKDYITSTTHPHFGSAKSTITVNSMNPVYKIAVTFQHFSILLGDFDLLHKMGLMEQEDKDTWVVSLYDLMVIADYCTDETEFVDYLQTRNIIQQRNIKWQDELELFDAYLNENLKLLLSRKKDLSFICGSTDSFDRDYANIPEIKL